MSDEQPTTRPPAAAQRTTGGEPDGRGVVGARPGDPGVRDSGALGSGAPGNGVPGRGAAYRSEPPPDNWADRRFRPSLGDLFGLQDRAQRRRERMVQEILRNRRGEYTVPTWVLAVLLAVIVAGIAALVIFS